MPELAIIADDLTGALDATAPFAMRGIRTAVALSTAALPAAISGGARVVGVSTDSREVQPDEAREKVRAAVSALPEGTRIFKKVDSRLKGNIAAELDAMPHARSLVLPAIPAFGRWTRGGQLGGFGVSHPIDIATRLGRHAAKATIPDIGSGADIAAALNLPHDLPIGARGLAEAIAARMASDRKALGTLNPGTAARDTSLRVSPTYVVVGSTDPITLAQLASLRAAVPELLYIAAPNGVGPQELAASSRLTVLQVTEGPSPADRRAVAEALAQTVRRLAPPAGSTLMITGGATAQAVLGELRIVVLDLVGEVLPGLPLATGGGLTVITKSGGFGDVDTLRQLFAPTQAHQERTA